MRVHLQTVKNYENFGLDMKKTRTAFLNAIDILTDEQEFSLRAKKILSALLLAISSLLSFQSIAGTRFLFFPKEIYISPDLLSSTLALALIIPLYGRGILRWSPSVYGIIMFILLLAVFSSITKLAYAGGGDIPIYLIAIAISLSWLGVRAIAGMIWILVFVAAVYSATKISAGMGTTGFIFVATSFLGLLLHTNLSPYGIVSEMANEYGGFTRKAQEVVREDINRAKSNIGGEI